MEPQNRQTEELKMTLKESELLELKKSTSELREAMVSVAAILNKHGRGELYFGIKNDGAVIGQDVPDTQFKEVGTHFITVFKRKPPAGSTLGDAYPGLVGGLVERLVENQRKMLGLMKKDPYISKKELSLKLGISSTAIDKNIITLKKKGLLKRIGPDRGGHWEIQTKENKPDDRNR